MPLYEYHCECGHTFEKIEPWQLPQERMCKCGRAAERYFPIVNHTFGWRLDEQSHIPGHQDRLERAI